MYPTNDCCCCPFLRAVRNLFATDCGCGARSRSACNSHNSCNSCCNTCSQCSLSSAYGQSAEASQNCCGGFGSCSCLWCCSDEYYARQYGTNCSRSCC